MPRNKERMPPELRVRVMRRDRGICQIQGWGCWGTATEIHHVQERVNGGGHVMDNLVAVCHPCHVRETQRTQVERRRYRREVRRRVQRKLHPGLRKE
jgi:5-methylcytosine-specific restriction endonuclease McrA